MSPSPASQRVARIALVALVVVVLGAAYHFGILGRFAEPRTLAATLRATGVWGYLAFVVAYVVLQPFGVPGTIFIVAAPLIWPWPIAFALSMVGTMGASVVGFAFARFVAKDWVSARIPARLRKYDEALARSALLTVIVLRLILWMPQALHFFFGVSKVGFWTHFWGSIVGYALPLFAVSYLGAEMFDPSGAMRPNAWPIMAAMLAVSLVVAALFRAYGRRQLASGPRSAPAQD